MWGATGDTAWFGWPKSEAVETEVTNWFEAKNLDEEKAAIGRLNKAALDDVVDPREFIAQNASQAATGRTWRARRRPLATMRC